MTEMKASGEKAENIMMSVTSFSRIGDGGPCRDFYWLGSLTAFGYWDGMFGPILRPYVGAVGSGFLLVNSNVVRVCSSFSRMKELIALTGSLTEIQ